MRILHYSTGLPPYRNGGLVKYNMDLMKRQAAHGHEVSMVWPGRLELIGHRTRIKKRNNLGSVCIYEIINPLPVPIATGIKEPEKFMEKADITIYKIFLKSLRPDVIHVHSLMGLHKELILAAKQMHIKIIFTSHDYFGLCPRTDLFCNNQVCTSMNWDNCAACNHNALEYRKLKLKQSIFMQWYNSSLYMKPFVKKIKDPIVYSLKILLRKKKVVSLYEKQNGTVMEKENYKKLQEYYKEIYNEIDIFYFNSTLAERIFKDRIIVRHGRNLAILNEEIKDNRMQKEFGERLRITYLGSMSVYKGYYMLLEALDALYKSGKTNFECNVYFEYGEARPYLRKHKAFKYGELRDIFYNTDILVVPSLWYETFSFVTIEALSYGVPVMVTKNVGAKDVIALGCGFVVDPTIYDMVRCIEKIYNNQSILKEINRKICLSNFEFIFDEHVREVAGYYDCK